MLQAALARHMGQKPVQDRKDQKEHKKAAPPPQELQNLAPEKESDQFTPAEPEPQLPLEKLRVRQSIKE